MVDAVGTTKYTYTAGDQVRTEVPPSSLSTGTITNTYVNRLRTLMTLQQRTGWPQWTNAFAYDAAARLTNVTSPAGVFSYSFGSRPSTLVSRLSLPNTAYITNTFDSVARLTGTYLDTSANAVLDSALYGYNQANQRTAFTNAAGTYVQYSYDPIGQLKVANSSVSTENRGYFYDSAWNLNRLTNNGTPSTFSVDVKNQLTADPNSGTDTYDSNGNLIQRTLSGGTLVYGYDDENRLTNVVLGTTFNSVFAYDGLSRLRSRTDYWWTGTNWYQNTGAGYIYDGNRVIQERNGSSVPVVSYTRGIDLSGSLEGAGGIGGLLARSSGYSTGNWTMHHFYHADGNGNITYLIDSSQALAASYRYDSFGNTLSSYGPIASTNLYRFSSQLIDLNTGMYAYLYRFYDPSLQRWLNRDRFGERGDLNLYRHVGNSPGNYIDPFGLDRYLYFFGHMWIGVDVYDANGNVIGQKDLNFAPEALWGNNSPGQISPDYTVNDPSESYPHCKIWTKRSSRSDDEGLMNRWQQAKGDPRYPRWDLLYNCYTCSLANFGSNQPLPPIQPSPPYSGGPVNAPPAMTVQR